MILYIYKAEPEYRFYYDTTDIDISKYDFHKSIITNYISIEEITEAIENKELDFDFEESDLIELAPGSEELNMLHDEDSIGYKTQSNFLVVYGLGVKQIALESKELAFKRLKSIFQKIIKQKNNNDGHSIRKHFICVLIECPFFIHIEDI